MDYLDLYRFLRTTVKATDDCTPLGDGLCVSHLDFTSEHARILPGERQYACADHGPLDCDPDTPPAIQVPPGFPDLQDSHVGENRAFRYAVFHREGRARGLVLLLHGLNEKDWFKYLPWAHHLARTTGRAVALFPSAFHMNRALREWSDHRLMHRMSDLRRKAFPEVVASSLSNVAISTRLHARPQRFIWSGLQTYCDLVQLLRDIRAGRHPLVAPDAAVDILAYSIGCLLSQILVMTDPDGLFARTRLGMFCGGAVFNRMSPVTKFILDSEANVALYSYLVEHLESHMKLDARLRHYLEGHPEGRNFCTMLNYRVMRREREEQFRRLAGRLMAVALEKDTVIPPYEVVNTLQGSARDIPVPVEVLDFPYPYQHEDPFPALEAQRAPVDAAFRRVFDALAGFYTA